MPGPGLARISIKFAADLTQFSSQMQNASRSINRVAGKLRQVGTGLTAGVTLPIVALGATATRVFVEFEQQMANVRAVSGATEQQFKRLTEQAKELGRTTVFTASDVASLQLNLSKLGFNTDEIEVSTESILKLAQATGEDLAESATVAASTIRGFGLSASETDRVVDIMAKGFSSSALDLNKFSVAMSALAPVAKNAGVEIERATALVGILANNGVDASTAGTALRNIFLKLAEKGLSFNAAMEQINSSSNKNAEALALFGTRGATVATILASSGVEVDKLTAKLQDAGGAAKAMADIMSNTASGSLAAMRSAIEGVQISIGEALAPVLRKLADFVSRAAAAFQKLSPATQRWIVILAGVAAAIGPIILFAGTILPALISGFALLTGPIGLVLAGLTAIAVVVADNWDYIVEETREIRDAMTELYEESALVRAAVNSIGLVFKAAFALAKFNIGITIDAFGLLLRSATTIFKNIVVNAKTAFSTIGNIAKAALSLDFDQVVQEFRTGLGQLESPIGDLGKSFNKFFDSSLQEGEKLFQALASAGADFVDAVQNDKITLKAKVEVESTEVAVRAQQQQDVEKQVEGVVHPFREALIESVEGVEAVIRPVDLSSLVTVGDLPEKVEEFNLQAAIMQENARQLSAGIEREMQRTAAAMAAGIGEAIGSLAAGGNGLANIGSLFLNTLADMAIRVGKLAIGIGTAVLGVKKALESLNPVVAIAAGVALVALGTLAKQSLANIAQGSGATAFANGGIVYGPTLSLTGEYAGARNNPEVIAPLNKLKSLLGDSYGGNVNVSGQLRLAGNDLVASISRTNSRNNRTR